MPEPAIGRIVHYVLEDGPAKGDSRPGQIVAVFPQSEGPALLNLVVTLDGVNDGILGPVHSHRLDAVAAKTHSSDVGFGDRLPNDDDRRVEGSAVDQISPSYLLHVWETSVAHAEAVGSPPTYVPGTWHWPPGVS